jgi:hypothetical protein
MWVDQELVGLYVYKTSLSNAAILLAILKPLKVFLKTLALRFVFQLSEFLWGQEVSCVKAASHIRVI